MVGKRYKKLLIFFGTWIGTVITFVGILWILDLKAGVTDFSKVEGSLGIILVGAFLADILVGILAFLLLCAELLHLIVFKREKAPDQGEKYHSKFENPLEKITLAR